MLSVAHTRSIKVIFTTLLVVCLLGICLSYFVHVKTFTSRSADTMFSTLTQMLDNKLNSTSNETVTETIFSNKNTSENGYSHQINYESKKSLKITIANNSSSTLTQEVFFKTTTMTFNDTPVVQCKESPYIECATPDRLQQQQQQQQSGSGKTFKITYLGRPFWIKRHEVTVTSCKFNQCVFNDTPVTIETDIVILYAVHLRDSFRVQPRWPHQLYVLQAWEPPFYSDTDYITNGQSPWNSQINLIMSYRLDADMFVPYYQLKFNPKPTSQRPDYYEIAKKKTRTAVWMVSHCHTQSMREHYVEEMQKYIDIDIFGRCGTPCGKNGTDCNTWSTKYKFYLSFENSLCTDYVTEKFFKLFDPNIHVIPVVRGGADYDKHFPNFTYINSAHFKTPKDLALHLKHLASDLETYSKYLEHKDMYTRLHGNSINKIFACKLCSYLHTHQLTQPLQTYNLTKYFVNGQCFNAADL